eukprot:CAMPEP_0185756114 /NCGR_PEP_ID=MMETSP1174-20130828/14558_1 /TAXON_ID=35687 /ORGANISM="Dictyocha speculum, Strain CCMP1381" /LENGTH=318 /DNA_ID=CAMNT_0028434941 /DNA_START=490 /DNA_END=1446 /DNA_ORIENTATION=+
MTSEVKKVVHEMDTPKDSTDVETTQTTRNMRCAAVYTSGYILAMKFGYTQLYFEFLAAILTADILGGLAHMLLDYSEVSSDELRLHRESTMPAVEEFEKTDKRFLEASSNDQYLWNFHIHHEVTYPSADSDFELWTQIAIPLAAPCAATLLCAYFSLLPQWFTRSFSIALVIGSFTQKTHFWAHARNHKDLHGISGRIIITLQDYGIIVHPDLHRKHHEEFDCNFCILTGQANFIVNALRRFLTYINAYGPEAPTSTTRRQRAELEKAAGSSKISADAGIGKKDDASTTNIGLFWVNMIAVFVFSTALVTYNMSSLTV